MERQFGNSQVRPRDDIRILVVEDNPAEEPVIKSILEEKFYAAVETAGSCDAARRKIAMKRFDIITLENRLPDGDGLELLEEFAGMSDAPSIIVITASGDEETAARSLRLGAAGYLIKDENLEAALLDAIENIIAKKILRITQEQVRLESERSEALAEISRALFEAGLDYQSVLDAIGEHFAGLVDGGCIIDLLSENRKWLVSVRIVHKDKKFQDKLEEMIPRIRSLHDNDAHFNVMKTGIPFIIPETVDTVLESAGVKLHPDITREREVGILMILPLGTGDRVIGTLSLMRGPDQLPFSEDEQLLLMEAADRITLTIENSRLYNAVQGEVFRRKLAEDELSSVQAELEGYAHTVSHELKGPLSSIIMSLDLLRRMIEKHIKPKSRGEFLELAEAAKASAMKAFDYTVSLLSLAEAEEPPGDLTKVNVNEIVKALIKEHSDEIERLGARVEIDEELGQLYANPAQISRIFSNLLSNALRHNNSHDPSVRIMYKGELSEEGHRYIIKDNGPGIDDDELEKIFLPFFKGASGRTGISLAVVDRLVRVYGGGIKAYNDNGACFEFTLNDLTT